MPIQTKPLPGSRKDYIDEKTPGVREPVRVQRSIEKMFARAYNE
ncbi:hypothetical protein ACTHPH_21550 [Paenibacillus pasadenensis]|uniref:Uncharacterized protein n=1 Tax=Paenibacillus pasadenensis TaxID=217090 RepID=A0A2N5N475_9BACL|nr:hypothetical protein [Paenibacillus pasadenensis]PLT45133.1 hypothetical protein B8V81_3564 [Paenibacillus pasadenensis]